jgi:hypothetical protein
VPTAVEKILPKNATWLAEKPEKHPHVRGEKAQYHDYAYNDIVLSVRRFRIEQLWEQVQKLARQDSQDSESLLAQFQGALED